MITRKLLTEAVVGRVRAPVTGQTFLWDSAVHGFGVRVLPGGSKTFWYQYRPRGSSSSRMIRVGVHPEIAVGKARKIASTYAGKVAEGGNPAADLQAERMRDKASLRVLLAEGGPYERELQRRHIVNVNTAMSALRRGLHRLMPKEVAALTRADLVGAITAIEDEGRPGAAHDLRKFTRVFLEWSVGRGFLTANPLAGLPPADALAR